jgi:hypothetical protein
MLFVGRRVGLSHHRKTILVVVLDDLVVGGGKTSRQQNRQRENEHYIQSHGVSLTIVSYSQSELS